MVVELGIDTGGTFTDLIGIDDETGELVVAKTPSTPSRPVEAIMSAIDQSAVRATASQRISIGTTVATNALLQRTGATVIFVTTAGFEDIPYIQRMNRKYHFSLKWTKPRPLVERRNCLGVAERLDFHGRTLIPLTDEALEDLAGASRSASPTTRRRRRHRRLPPLLLRQSGPRAAPARVPGSALPGVPVSLSHQVAPIWREYERGSTVIADGYVKPIMQRYIEEAFAAFAKGVCDVPWSLMKSNGGKTPADAAEAEPVKFLLSGLAGGIIAGQYFGQLAGRSAISSPSIWAAPPATSGSSATARSGYSTNFEIEWGLPVATPTIDLTTIGAGGGSIAWIDKGGLLRVGPQSAGADPGPACYDTGGEEVTVTDANLVLGRLNPEYFLGGTIPLSPAKAEAKLDALGESPRARPLGDGAGGRRHRQ